MNKKSILLTICTVMFLTITALDLKEQTPSQTIAPIPEEMLRLFYASYAPLQGLPISIAMNVLVQFDSLKELYATYKISLLSPDTPGEYNKRFVTLIRSAEEPPQELSLEDLPHLLADAKSIITSFLADGNDLDALDTMFIKKNVNPLGRIFTYSLLQRVIEEKKLSHVRLPRKVVVLQNKETLHYVSPVESLRIIDDNLMIQDVGYLPQYRIVFDDTTYSFHIFAQRQENKGIPSDETMQELYLLYDNVPFDVGFDNIFFDEKGDAIIIDTEIKLAQKEHCIQLERYRP